MTSVSTARSAEEAKLPGLSRRSLIKGATGLAAAAALAPKPAFATLGRSGLVRPSQADALFAGLDAKIMASMQANAIPGVAVGVIYQGQEYLRGYGVTNVDAPQPVDADTLFRIASTTKNFTGTTIMRLVDAKKVDLNAKVRTYVPEFTTADPRVAERVTVRHLVNMSAGWLGELYTDFGRGDDAIAKYVAAMAELPQLTWPGTTFHYNNAAIVLAGRVIEKVTGKTYEAAVKELVLDPLGMDHSGFFTDELIGYPIAVSHGPGANGQAVVQPSWWYIPRDAHPTGGLISSVRDQLTYARFHLGDGRAADGTRLMSQRALERMRTLLGPGGTLFVELTGEGVTWHMQPTAEGVPVANVGGDAPGQHSGFLLVPDRDFAITLLTNSLSGTRLRSELFFDDWAIQHFLGLHNPPAVPRALSPEELAPYEGDYRAESIGEATNSDDPVTITRVRLTATDGGRLSYRLLDANGNPLPPSGVASLAFYRPDYVLPFDAQGRPITSLRADFIRNDRGRVKWFRFGGRLHRKIT